MFPSLYATINRSSVSLSTVTAEREEAVKVAVDEPVRLMDANTQLPSEKLLTVVAAIVVTQLVPSPGT